MTFFDIDTKTTMLFLLIGNLATVVMFWVYIKGTKNKIDGLNRVFLSSKICQALAWFLICLQGKIHPFFSSFVGNMFLLTGQGAECVAIIYLVAPIKNGLPKRCAYLGIFFFSLIIWLSLQLMIPIHLDRKISLGILLSSFFFTATSAFFLLKTDDVYLYRAVGTTYLICGAGMFIRSLNIIGVIPNFIDSFNVFKIASVGFITTIMFTSNITFILIKKDEKYKYLTKMATEDPLTGALNRSAFKEAFSSISKTCKTEETDLSLLMIDLDYFKKVNDKFGHLVGDEVLKDLVMLMKKTLKREGIIGRYGGEEFTVILPNKNITEAHKTAETIRSNVECHFRKGEKPTNCTISIGVSSWNPSFKKRTIEELILYSDKALYEAKRRGRNRIVSVKYGMKRK